MMYLIVGLVVYLLIGILVVKTKIHRLLQWHLNDLATFFPIDGFSYALIEDWEQEVMLRCQSWKEYFYSHDHRLELGWIEILMWPALPLAIMVSYPLIGMHKTATLLR